MNNVPRPTSYRTNDCTAGAVRRYVVKYIPRNVRIAQRKRQSQGYVYSETPEPYAIWMDAPRFVDLYEQWRG